MQIVNGLVGRIPQRQGRPADRGRYFPKFASPVYMTPFAAWIAEKCPRVEWFWAHRKLWYVRVWNGRPHQNASLSRYWTIAQSKWGRPA